MVLQIHEYIHPVISILSAALNNLYTSSCALENDYPDIFIQTDDTLLMISKVKIKVVPALN
jgi:hypothetical protein